MSGLEQIDLSDSVLSVAIYVDGSVCPARCSSSKFSRPARVGPPEKEGRRQDFA